MTTSQKPYESLLRSAPYLAATLFDFAAMSRSITVRQPALNSARCLNMHAVIFGMSGISELHRRNASPVHICWASALNAKLDVDDSDDKETATASTRPAWRSAVAKDEDILGSRCGAGHWRVVMPISALPPVFRTVTSVTSVPNCDVHHLGGSRRPARLVRGPIGRVKPGPRWWGVNDYFP